jgi:hypothetical protein
VNVIRKGADFEEFAVIDGLVDIIDIWPIRALFEDESVVHTGGYIALIPCFSAGPMRIFLCRHSKNRISYA